MKTVGNFPDLASARVAQSLLESDGIPSTIPDAAVAGLDWRLGSGLGGVRLQVAAENAEAAAAVLDQSAGVDPAELDRLAEAAEPPSDRDTCPACGSEAIGPEPRKRRAKALTILFPPVLLVTWPFMAFARRSLLCSACGHRWHPPHAPAG